MGYDNATLKDMGFNTWRIWNDITVFEPVNDTSYGALSPADIKANVNAVPWDIWDKNMGPRRSFFGQTKADGVKLMLALRNTGVNHSASWMANPLRTTADNNEWWEHVFATIYWLNVRNDYQVDDFEVFNEPDNNGQGWGGTEADYLIGLWTIFSQKRICPKPKQKIRQREKSVYRDTFPDRLTINSCG